MRNLLLASAAVIATFATVSGEAKADYWATLNINYGYVDGDLWAHDFTVTRDSSIGTANIGALDRERQRGEHQSPRQRPPRKHQRQPRLP